MHSPSAPCNTTKRERPSPRVTRLEAVYWPALLAILVGLVLATKHAGFAGQTWYPAALFLLALLVLTLTLAPPHALRWPRSLIRALVLLGAFCAWALASALWSDVPAAAWDGAHRAVLYGIVLALVAMRRWPPREYALALGMIAAGIGAIAIGVLVDGALRADPAELFIDRRLASPAGYANATASLWLIGLWPALALACWPRLNWGVRGASLATACLLLGTSLLSVSRGAVASLILTALIFIALTRSRARAALAVAVVAGGAALAAGPVLAVSDAPTVADLERALPAAQVAIAWTSVLAGLLGAAAILLARRGALAALSPARFAWRPRARWIKGLVVASAAAFVLLNAADPVDWAGDRWTDFKTAGYSDVRPGSGRLTGSLGSGRYDYYRVAVNEFLDHPVAGIGYESFQVSYLIHRRTDETPRYTHSLAFAVLSQLGLVGVALFLAFLAHALAMIRRALAAAAEQRILVAGAVAGFSVWFAHGLVDWLWEFPALGILAFALLGLAMRGCAALEPEAADASSKPTLLQWPNADRRRAWVRTLQTIGAVGAIAVAASFASLGAAARLTQLGGQQMSSDPALAAAQLERAAQFDFLGAGPLVARGVLARREGDGALAERSFRDALGREPRNWFASVELALTLAAAGHRDQAIARLGRAERLNPRQELIDDARNRLKRGESVMPVKLERALSGDVRARLKSVP